MAKIATPAILLTTLPMITGVGVAAGVSDTPFPPEPDVLDGEAPDVASVPPPGMSPPASDVGSGD